ncbi:LacI family DNA-binding transcriptional regulator [Microbacterium sp. CIAB417]|uniref:LacI family DNA-binding transcriptional regulator n=1 Tax=Microbacterium sp. CIAB417 TaxID=2860287 RepID=UPI001FADB609|nr:LacI family DNA-binding transcriptional regulator [Microbacterium sp. CIAB417]
MATIQDVAKAAGVSPMTVSNVLNGHPHVRESTRQKVLAAVEELDYRVNAAARNLRTGRTGTIGLAVPNIGDHYFARLAALVATVAGEEGYRVEIEHTDAQRERELEAMTLSQNRMHDGLLLSTVGLGPQDKHLLRVDYPVVLLGEGIFDSPLDHIAMPNIDGSRAATAHLVAQGSRRIAIIDIRFALSDSVRDLRLEGYQQALRDAGIEPDPRLFFDIEDFTMQEGLRAARRIASSGLPVDGVFCPTDGVAIGALRGLADAGIRVPEDIRVIGFDDLPESEFLTPRLSSVSPAHEVTARTAVTFLLERIRGTAPADAREFVTPFELRARASTA